MQRKFILLTLLAALVNISYSQTNSLFLPNTPAAARYDLALDSGDTLWLGSNSIGLQRYFNGNYLSFTTTNSGISSNFCRVVSIDSGGNIWCGGYNGISIFNHSVWTNYSTQNSGLINDTILCIEHSSNGAWIGTPAGLCYFDGNTWLNYTSLNSGILSNRVLKIALNADTIYTGHSNGISCFDGSWTIYPDTVYGLGSNNINMTYAAGHLWVTDLYKELYYLKNNTFYPFVDLLMPSSPRPYNYVGIVPRCTALTTDQNNNLQFVLDINYNLFIAKIIPQLTVSRSRILDGSMGLPSHVNGSAISSNVLYTIGYSGSGLKAISIDTATYSTAPLYTDSPNTYLDINNITAKMLNRGDMHWDPVAHNPQYYTDLNSTQTAVFASAIWLGGIDQGGQLHTSAMTYRQQGSWDFWTGPLDTISGASDSATSAYYDRFWKIDYDMIQSFLINYQNGNLQNGSYTLPEAIATWPAHGTGNYSRKLAPFIDNNNDGVYNPYDGDYPELTGHQMLWWVFNDTLAPFVHTESGGRAFQYEIHGKAYGFNCNLNSQADEVMNYTTFYQYEIINRSQNTYTNAYVGLWTDFDLGYAADDYVGCDTMLNTFFCYNGDNDDEGLNGYGLNPPIINVTYLKGPTAVLNDNLDNNHNGFVDETNETNGMNGYMFYKNINLVPDGNPANADDFYHYLRSFWLNGQPLLDSTGTPIKFIFPGTPYTNGPTMSSAGIMPDDMRGVGSSGPFTIAPGESQTIDFAYIFTRDSINPNGLTTSIAKNTADVQKIINGFNSGNYPCLTSVGMPQLATKNLDFSIYPKPTTNSISFNKEMNGAAYKIYNITGQLVKNGVFSGSPIMLENLQSQLYIVKAVKDNQHYVKRFVKI